MGKAYKAPEHDRTFRFHITQHAVERFRERVDEEFRSRSEYDLALLLDERVFYAIRDKRCTDIVDAARPEQDTKVALIENRTGMRSYVVLRAFRQTEYPRPKLVGGPAGLGLVAVTVLTEEMGSANFANSVWYVPNRPFAGKLAGITPAAPAPRLVPPPPKDEPAASTPAKPSTVRERSTLLERSEFAKRILRERPHISSMGRDGLAAVVEARFGVGMSYDTITKLREIVESERTPAAPTPPVAEGTPSPGVVTTAAHVAIQLAQAMETERSAKARKLAAERELAASQSVLDGATAQVEKLLGQMQEARS